MLIPMLIAILAAFFYATGNHIDKHLLTRIKGADYRALCITSSLVAGGMMTLIYVFICGFDFSFDWPSVLILLIDAALLAFAVHLLYFQSLARDDTIIVAIMWQLIPVFEFIMAPLFLPNQELRWVQLLGGLVITAAAIGVTYEPEEKKFSRHRLTTLAMVAVSSVAYTVWYIILRYVNETHDFNKTVLWSNICLFTVGLIAYCISKKYRKSFLKMIRLNGKKAIALNLCNELICSLADTLIVFAGTLAPIALAAFVSQGVQPFAVMILGVLLVRLFPKIEHEKVSKRETIRRLLAMVFCLIGLALIQFG